MITLTIKRVKENTRMLRIEVRWNEEIVNLYEMEGMTWRRFREIAQDLWDLVAAKLVAPHEKG